jgi:hypothetical protein
MKSLQSAILVLVFAAVVGCLYLYVIGDLKVFDADSDSSSENTTFLKTEEEFRLKLAELRIDREKLQSRKKLMEERKAETVAFLKDKGVTSKSDLSDADVKYAVNNLKRAVRDLKEVDRNIGRYSEGILAVEAMLDKLEQERLANEIAVSDERKIEISAMVKRLDDELITGDDDIFGDEELEALLGEELSE